MPTRSLNSSILKWPDAKTVQSSLQAWALDAGRERPDVTRIGFFGSYARGNWGVGSDLDVIIIVDNADESFELRASGCDTTPLPVPVDLLVYTQKEWESLDRKIRLPKVLDEETVWVYERAHSDH